MGEYRPTDMAIKLASMNRDAAFIQADIEDDKINDRLLDYECTHAGITVDELDAEDPDEAEEIEKAIDEIPVDPNAEYDEIMKIVQTNKPKISIDEVMGLAESDDTAILEELMGCCE